MTEPQKPDPNVVRQIIVSYYVSGKLTTKEHYDRVRKMLEPEELRMAGLSGECTWDHVSDDCAADTRNYYCTRCGKFRGPKVVDKLL